MITLTPHILDRQFNDTLAQPAVQWFTPRMGWAAIGGPTTAEVVGRGSVHALASQFDRLRCPVVLRTERGVPCWWGYIADVELRYGKTRLAASLDHMANWITVLYSEEGMDDAVITAPATDDYSIALYGIKELRENGNNGLDLAEARRDLLLTTRRKPIPRASFGEAVASPELRYICRGWFSTLWWRYLLTTGTELITTTAAIAEILAQVGQFFPAVRFETDSSLLIEPIWDGTAKAGDVLVKLCEMGNGQSARLLPQVSLDRTMRIVAEPMQPSNDQSLLITSDGAIHSNLDQPLPPWVAPVGRWATVRDVPATLTWGYMANPTTPFLEAAEFDGESGRWQFTTRGIDDVFEALATIPM